MTAPAMVRRRTTWVALVSTALVAVGAGWWAAQATVSRPSGPESSASGTSVLATVSQASVGRDLAMNVTVTQPFVLVASNGLPGVVTGLGVTDPEVGDLLYQVAGISVRAVQGTVPFYRDLVEGSTGEDVLQLQGALADLGLLRVEPDGELGPATTRAIKAWQKSLGAEQSGVVRLGEVVALPTLPTTVRLGEDVVLGAVLSGGEPAVLSRTGAPEFDLVVTTDQAAIIPAGTAVDVRLDETTTWSGVAGAATARTDGSVAVAVRAADGTLVCGDTCALLPAEESLTLTSRVQIEPAVSGAAVPVAAISTDASGATTVRRSDESVQEVVVLGSGDGLAVVSGLEIGDEVVLIGRGPEETG